LIDGVAAQYLLADRGNGADEIFDQALLQKMKPVIRPEKNRKNSHSYAEYIYKVKRLVENAFLKLKQWRGIATRYAKNTASFFAAIHIRCIFLWTSIS
jgi:transposase